ncbi:folliculin-interacting protein 2-like [Scylla paramamosain]|uniref:folliculin-interacting protein 2-like n=1 Tax=Scylla paramamosain TaxID=85552 RepID=UPI0030833709
MDLWHKLFTIRKKNEPNRPHKATTSRGERVAQQDSSPLLLQENGIRVLLFRECNTRGRKLLYDSKTVVQVPLGDAAPHASSAAPKALFKGSWGSVGPPAQLPSHKCPVGRTAGQRNDAFAEISGGYGYQYQQKEGDTKVVGELVFGSVDLAYRGSCSKLHLLQEPSQRVLLSRTAPAPTSHLPRHPAASDPGIEDSSFSSSVSSLSDAAATSGSLEVPWGAGGAHTLAIRVPQCLGSSLSEGDSGFGGPPSAYSSTCGSFLSPASVPSTPHGTPSSRQGSGNSLKNSGSLNSLQRRFLRSVNTSLEALGVMEEGGGRGRVTQPPQPKTSN